MPAKTQKDCNEGSTDVAPMPKAIKSVKDVIVMATPECLSARPKRAFNSFLESVGS